MRLETEYALKQGEKGDAGNGVESSVVTYAIGSDGVTVPDTWQSELPTTTAEKPYLWSKTTITYTDGTGSIVYSVGGQIVAAEELIDQTANSIRQDIDSTEENITKSYNSAIANALDSYSTTEELQHLNDIVNQNNDSVTQLVNSTATGLQEQVITVDKKLEDGLKEIKTYFNFADALTIGRENSPYQVVISDSEYDMMMNGQKILWFDGNGKGYIPELTVPTIFSFLGYAFTKDSSGNVNLSYVGEG